MATEQLEETWRKSETWRRRRNLSGAEIFRSLSSRETLFSEIFQNRSLLLLKLMKHARKPITARLL